ncbi:MAG: hypothetical protein NTW21_44750 [Verrucomicrobia bacterium]|nr:hypothetical protein [Verrucomicrobiota bacterium]
MKTPFPVRNWTLVIVLVLAATALCQVPRALHHQGQVAVNGGTKTTGVQATATANVVNKFVVNYKTLNGGSGYTDAPKVTITDATGSGATAVATVSGGCVTAITGTSAGSGYSDAPIVTIDPPPSPAKIK